jgi:hypothetical protein
VSQIIKQQTEEKQENKCRFLCGDIATGIIKLKKIGFTIM